MTKRGDSVDTMWNDFWEQGDVALVEERKSWRKEKWMKKTGCLSWINIVSLHPVRQRESWSREDKPNRDNKRSSNRKLRNCRWETYSTSQNPKLSAWKAVSDESGSVQLAELILHLRTKSNLLVWRSMNAVHQNFEYILPPQDMDWLVTDLQRQLKEQSAKIANIKNIVEMTQKERSQAEELLMDQLEVGPTVHLFQWSPNYPRKQMFSNWSSIRVST